MLKLACVTTLLAATLVGTSGSSVTAEETLTATGTIAAVDEAKMLVTIEVKKDEKTEKVELKVVDTTKITVNGKDGKIAEIKKGMDADAKYAKKGDVNEASSIDAKKHASKKGAFAPETVKGKIAAIDEVKKTVTIDKTEVKVVDTTKITLDGKDAKLADLKKDMEATAEYDAATKVATSIAAKKAAAPANFADETVKGKIAAIDEAKKAVTIDKIEVKVTEKTKITVDGKDAKLADLKKDMDATAMYDKASMEATSIAAKTAAK